MARSKSEASGRWIRLCFQCWIAPLLFLASSPYLALDINETDKTQQDQPDLTAIAAVLGPLLGIVAASLAGMLAALLGCSPCRIAPVQFSVQLLILLYAHGIGHGFLDLGESVSGPETTHGSMSRDAAMAVFGAHKKFLDKRTVGTGLGRLGTMSVVLPCLNEPYAYKTVMKFCNRTPPEAGLDSQVPHLCGCNICNLLIRLDQTRLGSLCCTIASDALCIVSRVLPTC